MRLLIAAIAFAATLGGLLLAENFKVADRQKDRYAQVVEAMRNGGANESPTAGHKSTNQPSRTISPTATLAPTPTPTPQNNLATSSPLPTFAPSPAPTEIPSLVSSTPETPMPTSITYPAPESTPEQLGKININTAGYEELQKITGVGPVIAQRIVDYRETNGPFQKIEDIKGVKGIGDKTFEKMRDQITI